jgi:hypothetical protein
MNSKEHLRRRDAFIADMVEVCKKHKVMISPDRKEFDSADVLDVSFDEINRLQPMSFYVSLVDIEDEIRRAVRPIVHPDSSDDES